MGVTTRNFLTHLYPYADIFLIMTSRLLWFPLDMNDWSIHISFSCFHSLRLARWGFVYIWLIIYSVSKGGMVKNGNEFFQGYWMDVLPTIFEVFSPVYTGPRFGRDLANMCFAAMR